MSWLNLLWILLIVALCSWALANLLIAAFTPLLKSSHGVAERRPLWLLALVPWLLPLLATASLMLLALAKRLGWIQDHCLIHQAHHPHFCLQHLPEMTLQLGHSLAGAGALLALLILFTWRMAQLFRLFKQSAVLRKLVKAGRVKNTLEKSQPLAFTLGVRQPLIFISHGLRKLLNRRQLRIVINHEIAHIRNRDVLKNTLFEILLGLHLYPRLLRSRWYLSAEVRADAYVSRRFDSLEVADVLIKLQRAGVNSPFPVSVGGGVLPTRIDYLLNANTKQTHSQTKRQATSWLFYLSIAAFPFALACHHHSLETLWGWLL